MKTHSNLNFVDYFSFRRAQQTAIVDLRSPSEFQQGHIPGAQNIPLFDDHERHQVGWTYKQVGRLEAIQLGLELLAAKMDSFLSQFEGVIGAHGEVFLYCWRGGMRSQSVAKLMSSLGYHVYLQNGGYKTYRRGVLRNIDALTERDVLVLMGRTGVGKTEFLRQLSGVTVLDLEGIASHRGSVFGDVNQSSRLPSQQNFENLIVEITRSNPNCPIVVEIENYFGPINVPKPLRERMLNSPILVLERSKEGRIQQILKDYASNWSDEVCEQVCERIELGLAKHFPPKTVDGLKAEVRAKNLSSVVGSLLDIRYDPLYDKQLFRHRNRVIASVDVSHSYEKATQFVQRFLEQYYAKGNTDPS